MKLARFFTHCTGKWKSAPISKQTNFFRQSSRSYFVFTLPFSYLFEQEIRYFISIKESNYYFFLLKAFRERPRSTTLRNVSFLFISTMKCFIISLINLFGIRRLTFWLAFWYPIVSSNVIDYWLILSTFFYLVQHKTTLNETIQ